LNTSADGGTGLDLLPMPSGLHLEMGPGPVWSERCDLSYAQHPALVGCGAASHLAGHARTQPSLDIRPAALGFAEERATVAQNQLRWPVFVAADTRGQGAAKAVNDALEQIVERLRVHLDAHLLGSCTVVASNPEVVSVRCSGNAGHEFREAMSFRLGRAPYRITVDELFSARPNAVTAVAQHCARPYLKTPKDEYDDYLTAVPQWTKADLAKFALDGTRVQFEVELALKYGANPNIAPRRTWCRVPLKLLGTNQRTLAQ
jgi:hypothetical protein